MAKSEPIFNMPSIVTVLVLGMIGIHILRHFLAPETEIDLLLQFAFVPARFIAAMGADPLSALEQAAAGLPTDEDLAAKVEFARALLEEGGLKPWTLVTYALLHGNIAHLTLNMIWLAAFGSAVARRLGGPRFALFMAVTAAGGALAHLAAHWDEPMPLVGASASISGCMAAAALFVFQPGAPLSGFSFRDDVAYLMPALDLRSALRDRRVVSFLGVWAVLNVVAGLTSSSLGIDGAIAWEAHFGGFLVGLLIFKFIDPKRL